MQVHGNFYCIVLVCIHCDFLGLYLLNDKLIFFAKEEIGLKRRLLLFIVSALSLIDRRRLFSTSGKPEFAMAILDSVHVQIEI